MRRPEKNFKFFIVFSKVCVVKVVGFSKNQKKININILFNSYAFKKKLKTISVICKNFKKVIFVYICKNYGRSTSAHFHSIGIQFPNFSICSSTLRPLVCLAFLKLRLKSAVFKSRSSVRSSIIFNFDFFNWFEQFE